MMAMIDLLLFWGKRLGIKVLEEKMRITQSRQFGGVSKNISPRPPVSQGSLGIERQEPTRFRPKFQWSVWLTADQVCVAGAPSLSHIGSANQSIPFSSDKTSSDGIQPPATREGIPGFAFAIIPTTPIPHSIEFTVCESTRGTDRISARR